MKKNIKIFIALAVVAVLAIATVLIVVFGGDKNKNEETWDGRTYIVSVYLADGTTPVEGVRLALCYNTESGSNCLSPVKTDANGTVTITIPETIAFEGNPVLHFTNETKDIPDGYALPSNMKKFVMNDGSEYEHAIELAQKETKLVLSAE